MREALAYDNLADDEKKAYLREIENRRSSISEFITAYTDGKFEGEAIGIEKGEAIGLEKGEAERTKLKKQYECPHIHPKCLSL